MPTSFRNRIKIFLKKNWPLFVVIFLAAFFFVGVGYYNQLVRPEGFAKFGSPDETANYVFTKYYGQTGDISIFEKYNLYASDLMHPRSVRSDWGNLKPVSFLGIILIYGQAVSYLGYKILPYITPFLAGVGIIFYYLLVREMFGRRNALISSFLLTSFPVYIYYSARSMFHNIPFLVFLVISLYFSYLMVEKARKNKLAITTINPLKINWLTGLFAALGGFFLGLSLITRTSEAIWVAPVFFILWIFNARKVGVAKLAVFISFAILAWLPAGYWNTILFDSPIYGGYPEMNQSISEITNSSKNLIDAKALFSFETVINSFNRIKSSVFYFGFDLQKSKMMFYHYFVDMFPWIFWPAFFGFFLYFQKFKRWKRKDWSFILSFFITSAVLVLYYGSWQFHDNPDATSHTIGNSYTRYWLPIYLGAIPLTSLFIIKFSRGLFFFGKWRPFKNKELDWLKAHLKISRPQRWLSLRSSILVKGFRIVTVFVIVIISFNFVLFDSEEGLAYNVDKIELEKKSYNEVLKLTESNSVIITKYHDKIFFPQRKVVMGNFNDPKINEIYSEIAEHLPLYYYNFSFRQKDIDYLNSRRLKDFGLRVDKVEVVNHNFTLYKIRKQKK